MDYKFIYILLGICFIVTWYLYFKYYYSCIKVEKSIGRKLLPNCLWYIIFYLSLFSFFLSPISLIMVLNQYFKLKKIRKELLIETQRIQTEGNKEVVNNSFSTPSTNDLLSVKQNSINKDTNELKEILSEEELVSYICTDDIIECYYKNEGGGDRFKFLSSINNYDYVKKGDKIMTLSNWNNKIDILAIDDGYFLNSSSSINSKLAQRNRLFTIFKSSDALQNICFPSSFITGEEDFTKEPFIKATMYGGNKYAFSFGMIDIRIEYADKKHKLNVDFSSKTLQFTKNHTLHFLLDDSSVLTFSNFTRPIKYSKNRDRFSYINMTTSAIMSDQDIKSLASHKLIKWNLINDEGSTLAEIDIPSFVNMSNSLKDIHRKVFQDYVTMYLSLYDKIKSDIGDEDDEIDSSKTSTCYVYLMIDTTNNYHKIGISNNPKYREHTLQSDKPTIELLCAKEYPSRAIAEAIESALHKTYAGKRIRGEWFNLSLSDIEDIKKTLK